jgi:hypothetical protein
MCASSTAIGFSTRFVVLGGSAGMRGRGIVVAVFSSIALVADAEPAW